MNYDKIMLSHGGGGKETMDLIGGILFDELYRRGVAEGPAANSGYGLPEGWPRLLEDAAVIKSPDKIAFTTDSFTVSPIFFKGGDIGKLSVAGTVNDLSVMAARPLFLSLSLIIEEGFSAENLRSLVRSIAQEAGKTGVKIVTGDTKVVPAGKADGIFINTSGIGEVIDDRVSVYNITPKDAIIISGNVGDHGAAIMSEREGIAMDVNIKSDCASLWDMIEPLLNAGIKISAMRDATRGGIAAVLNEWARTATVDISIEEDKIPVHDAVKGFCELLGLEPYQLACEGRAVFAVNPDHADKALKIIKSHPLGEGAAIIGEVSGIYKEKDRDYLRGLKGRNISSGKGIVAIKGPYGVSRILDYPSGEILPRIC